MGRVFHSDSRFWSLFVSSELVKLTGVPQGRWPVYVAKELLDNAVAALEEHQQRVPIVKVTVCNGYIEVSDNGTGIGDGILDRVMDFTSFGGSNRHMKLPTRGSQGNALGTVVGIAAQWKQYIEVRRPSGPSLRLTVSLDAIRQQVNIERTEISEQGEMSSVRVPWPELPWKKGGSTKDEVEAVVVQFASLNPHVTFMLNFDGQRTSIPSEPGQAPVFDTRYHAGSARWFTLDEFAARLAADIRARPELAVGAWLSEYAFTKNVPADNRTIGIISSGLSETGLKVLAEGLYNRAKAMTDQKMADDPRFRPLGEDRMADLAVRIMGADTESPLEYKLVRGVFNGIPHLVEVCLVQMPLGARSAPEPIVALNRTVLYGSPSFRGLKYREKVRGDWHEVSGDLGVLARAYQIDHGKTCSAVIVHAVCPSPGYSGYGKQQFDSSWLVEPLSECMERVTLAVRKQRAGEARRSRGDTHTPDTIRETVFRLAPEVWDKDTEGGTLPILIRNLYYGVRGIWANHHHKKLEYATFCAYFDEYERSVGRQLALRDPRGTLIEPHSGKELRLGTDAANRYEPKRWEGHTLIFVEKEGFAHLLKAYGITKRYDAIVVGSKGFAVEACREVLQKYRKLLGDVVKIVALHDSDPAGYMIGHDLATNLPRFGMNVDIKIIDSGLRMDQARGMGLQDEPFDLSRSVWSMIRNMRSIVRKRPDGRREPMLEPEAWDAFMPHMYRGEEYPSWADKPQGRRVELNAMKPRQFISWLEDLLDNEGCKKVRPPDEIVDETLKRSRENKVRNEVGGYLMRMLGDDAVMEIMREVGIPSYDLDTVLEGRPEQHWSYLVERAGQTGMDLEPIMKRVLDRRIGR